MLRWAAGHLLRRKKTHLALLRRRAAELDAHHGPAVIAGILDAVHSLTEGDVRRAIEFGLASGRAPVRKVALRVLADLVDRTEAVHRARADPDEQIRRWAPELEAETDDPVLTTLF